MLVPVGADEAGEGDEEYGESDEDDGPAEPVDAGVVGFGGEPDAGGDDWGGAEEGYEVEDGGYVVAHCHGGAVRERVSEREKWIGSGLAMRLVMAKEVAQVGGELDFGLFFYSVLVPCVV